MTDIQFDPQRETDNVHSTLPRGGWRGCSRRASPAVPLPALVAYINRRKQAAAILLLNLLLGWTFLGWVLPLFLACMPDDSAAPASTPTPAGTSVRPVGRIV